MQTVNFKEDELQNAHDYLEADKNQTSRMTRQTGEYLRSYFGIDNVSRRTSQKNKQKVKEMRKDVKNLGKIMKRNV